MKTNKVIITALSVITLLFLTGCMSSPKKMTNTKTGRPEVIISSIDVDNIKSQIISDNLQHGYIVMKDTPHLLELRRSFTDEENANQAQMNVLADGLASLLVGGMGYGYSSLPSTNYYSDKQNYRTVSITLLKSKKSTRVVATNFKNTVELRQASVFNSWQRYLFKLKDTIENNNAKGE